MGKPIGGLKEITDADVLKEKNKIAEVKRRSSLKAVVVERKQSLRKSNTPHEALPEFNINNSNKEESDGNIDDMELEEQGGIINTQSTGGGSNHNLKFDAGEQQLVEFPSQVIGMRKGRPERTQKESSDKGRVS